MTPVLVIDKQQMLGTLRATGSKDRDVLYARKQEMIAMSKVMRIMGMLWMVVGLLVSLTIILAVIGEELGFVGVLIVILLFYWMVRRSFEIGRTALQLDRTFAGLVARRGRHFGHRREQRAHCLGWSSDRGQPQRGGDLTQKQIAGQKARQGRALHPGHQRAGAFLKPVALHQSDHRQDDPDHRDIAGVVERLAEGGENRQRVHPRRQTRRQGGTSHHHKGIQPPHKAADHHCNAREHPEVHGL